MSAPLANSWPVKPPEETKATSETVITCPNCKAPWPFAGAWICNYCGYNRQTQKGPVKCTNCGAGLIAGQDRCSYCHYPVSDLGRAVAILRDPTPTTPEIPLGTQLYNADVAAGKAYMHHAKNLAVSVVLLGIVLAMVAFGGQIFHDPKIQSDFAQATAKVSALFGVVLFLAMMTLVLKVISKV